MKVDDGVSVVVRAGVIGRAATRLGVSKVLGAAYSLVFFFSGGLAVSAEPFTLPFKRRKIRSTSFSIKH
jgi:hypothetical protein